MTELIAEYSGDPLRDDRVEAAAFMEAARRHIPQSIGATYSAAASATTGNTGTSQAYTATEIEALMSSVTGTTRRQNEVYRQAAPPLTILSQGDPEPRPMTEEVLVEGVITAGRLTSGTITANPTFSFSRPDMNASRVRRNSLWEEYIMQRPEPIQNVLDEDALAQRGTITGRMPPDPHLPYQRNLSQVQFSELYGLQEQLRAREGTYMSLGARPEGGIMGRPTQGPRIDPEPVKEVSGFMRGLMTCIYRVSIGNDGYETVSVVDVVHGASVGEGLSCKEESEAFLTQENMAVINALKLRNLWEDPGKPGWEFRKSQQRKYRAYVEKVKAAQFALRDNDRWPVISISSETSVLNGELCEVFDRVKVLDQGAVPVVIWEMGGASYNNRYHRMSQGGRVLLLPDSFRPVEVIEWGPSDFGVERLVGKQRVVARVLRREGQSPDLTPAEVWIAVTSGVDEGEAPEGLEESLSGARRSLTSLGLHGAEGHYVCTWSELQGEVETCIHRAYPDAKDRCFRLGEMFDEATQGSGRVTDDNITRICAWIREEYPGFLREAPLETISVGYRPIASIVD